MTFKEMRKKANLTQMELAKKTDVTNYYISKLELGLKNPSDKMKMKLAEAMNVEPVDIFLAFQRTNCATKGVEDNGKDINA